MSVNKDEMLRNEVNESSEVAEAGAEAAKKTPVSYTHLTLPTSG